MSNELRPSELDSVGKANSLLWHGLLILHRAHLCAQATRADPWDYAIEIRELHRAGLTNSDLRWYLACRLVLAGHEVTLPGDSARAFRRIDSGRFTAETCFVLSATGIHVVGELDSLDLPHLLAACKDGAISVETPAAGVNGWHGKPHWDRDRKELRAGAVVVKRFRGPAINQETVLAVFEEEGWPQRIDDPLPLAPDQDAKRRLHDTIKCLNRNQKVGLLRFLGDGTGEGVLWEMDQHCQRLSLSQTR